MVGSGIANGAGHRKTRPSKISPPHAERALLACQHQYLYFCSTFVLLQSEYTEYLFACEHVFVSADDTPTLLHALSLLPHTRHLF